MYIVIKREKSDHLKRKVHELKKLAIEVMECLEEAYSDSHESESREHSRKDERFERRDGYHNYDDYDDYDRDVARGRSMRRRY